MKSYLQQINMLPTPQQIVQQNKLFYARQKLKASQLCNNIVYNRNEVPQLSSKYEGYMQIYRRKQGQNEPTEYYSSSFLNELKDKRNSMFSDEIIDKMAKQYQLTEYGSEVDWRKIASNGVDLTRTKFGGSYIQIENYKEITNKMLQR